MLLVFGGCKLVQMSGQRLARWLAGWLADELAGWLAGWLSGCLAGRLAGWLVAGRLLTGWLAG